jgi:hypothetical protein
VSQVARDVIAAQQTSMVQRKKAAQAEYNRPDIPLNVEKAPWKVGCPQNRL